MEHAALAHQASNTAVTGHPTSLYMAITEPPAPQQTCERADALGIGGIYDRVHQRKVSHFGAIA